MFGEREPDSQPAPTNDLWLLVMTLVGKALDLFAACSDPGSGRSRFGDEG